MDRLSLALLVVAIVAVGTVAVGTVGAETGEDATITLEVVSETDDTVEVVMGTDAQDAAGYEANVTYDPAVLTLDTIEGVDFDEPVTNTDDDAGWVKLTQAQGSGMKAPTFARLTFTVTEAVETELSFLEHETAVNNEELELLELAYHGATIGSSDQTDDGTDAVPEDDGDETGMPDSDEGTIDDSEGNTTPLEDDLSDETNETDSGDDDALPAPGIVALVVALSGAVLLRSR